MAELVQLPAGVGLEEDPGPVVAEARSSGLGAEVTSRRTPGQQQGEPQARRPALAGDLGQLLTDEGPPLDQLVFVELAGHRAEATPIADPEGARLRLVTPASPTPVVTRGATPC